MLLKSWRCRWNVLQYCFSAVIMPLFFTLLIHFLIYFIPAELQKMGKKQNFGESGWGDRWEQEHGDWGWEKRKREWGLGEGRGGAAVILQWERLYLFFCTRLLEPMQRHKMISIKSPACRNWALRSTRSRNYILHYSGCRWDASIISIWWLTTSTPKWEWVA